MSWLVPERPNSMLGPYHKRSLNSGYLPLKNLGPESILFKVPMVNRMRHLLNGYRKWISLRDIYTYQFLKLEYDRIYAYPKHESNVENYRAIYFGPGGACRPGPSRFKFAPWIVTVICNLTRINSAYMFVFMYCMFMYM